MQYSRYHLVLLAAWLGLQTLCSDLRAAPVVSLLQEKAFDYFWKTSTTNAFIATRTGEPDIISTEGTGFQLSALCLGAARGWITREDARTGVISVLTDFKNLPRFHGFWAECYDLNTLLPAVRSFSKIQEYHTLATAYLAAGIYTARAVFNQTDQKEETDIQCLCNELLDTIEWTWMLTDSNGQISKTLASCWSPNSGFSPVLRLEGEQDFRGVMAYLLAIASTNHPIPASCWYEGWTPSLTWNTTPDGTRFVSCPSLINLLQPQVWLDVQHRRDRTADYYQSTLLSIRANHAYATETLYPGQSLWGITDCMGPNGYEHYGFPPETGPVAEDAVLCPAAAIGSVLFTPRFTQDAIQSMNAVYRNDLWGDYGFFESFSPKNNWFYRGYATIHQGVIMGMLANAEDGCIQHWFMGNPEIMDALDRIGFTGTISDFEEYSGLLKPSLLIEPSAEYTVRRTRDTAAEGLYSLQIDYSKNRNDASALNVIPAARDFAPYRYLAVWIKGSSEPVFALEDENGTRMPLGRAIKGPVSDEWCKYYYPLPRSSDPFCLSAIQRIMIQADPSRHNTSATFFLDQLHLVNVLSVKRPDAPGAFRAQPARMPGELTLSWHNKPVDTEIPSPFRYHLRYANSPIRDARAFRRADPVPGSEQRIIDGNEQSFHTKLPAALQPYYFAIRAEDIYGALSEVVCSDPVTLSVKTPPPEFDLEHFDAELPHLHWTSSGTALTARRTTDVSLEGGGSLEIVYRKEGESSRWACLTAYPDIHDITAYRYLSIWVAGSADFVLRFIDSQGAQQDTTLEKSTNPDSWSPLFFDLSKLSRIDRSSIDRILLFVEPDKINIAGTVYIDSISLSNTRN